MSSALLDSLPEWRIEPPRWFAAALADTGATWSPTGAWTAWVAVVAAATVAALVAAGVGLAVVAAASVVGAPLLALSCRQGRAARLVDDGLPHVLDATARSLRSGATLPQALREVALVTTGRLGDDLQALVAEVDAGRPLLAAIDGWSARCSTPGVRLVTAAMSLAADTGGAAARAFDGVAATLRANAAVAGELRAQASQARLSGLVIALAPLVFGIFAMVTDSRTAGFLLRSRVGLVCLALGLALDAIAAWWMQRITAGVVA